MRLIISGGGIAGLTTGILAKQLGYNPIIIEKRSHISSASFGGGIGLWPNSQMVMQRIGILGKLQEESFFLPNACYYNSYGDILAQPSKYFNQKFPVMCLERSTLTKILYEKCLEEGVEFLVGPQYQIIGAKSQKNKVTVSLFNGQQIDARFLIGTDGIWSKIRNIIQKEYGLPQILPYHCQYAYFRAVTNLQGDESSQWHQHAFESWGQKKRFGYVPLKNPKTFWFVAIPIGQEGLKKVDGSTICTEDQKEWILRQFKDWKGPIDMKKLIEITPSSEILRTDIQKVRNVTTFPWFSKNKNIIILGDAANATAPNLAQGAGLAIESAWDFISMVNLNNFDGLETYIEKRKRRAKTVQDFADMVAFFGQLPKPWSSFRNFFMSKSTKYMPSLETLIFEEVVSRSLGGDLKKLYWKPPHVSNKKYINNIRKQSWNLGKIMGKQEFQKLPEKTQLFRSSLIASGSGNVSVKSIGISSLLGLPSQMKNEPFGAYCETYFQSDGKEYQKWVRIFGEKKNGAVKYETIHRSTPNLKLSPTGNILTESLGFGPDILNFGYLPKIDGDTLCYKSLGLWFLGMKLPLPSFILPTHSWTETQQQNGWHFEGDIKMPLILGGGSIMKYEGDFRCEKVSNPEATEDNISQRKNRRKRVIIAGGTGMIGKQVAKSFYINGWDVEILSRKHKQNSLPFVKIVQWNPESSQQSQITSLANLFQDCEVVINLSGSNPGKYPWTESTKKKILESRLSSIKLISAALQKLKANQQKQKQINKNLKQSQSYVPWILQASAAGVYGNRGDQLLNDEAARSDEQSFRVSTCKQIQNMIQERIKQNYVVLRIGHVLSSSGGILPHLNLASLLRVKKIGDGKQWVPWVHVQDAAEAFLHISNNIEKFKGKNVNIASPGSQTCEEIFKGLADSKNRKLCKVPIPQCVIKMVLGEMSSVLLQSQKMYPQNLLQNGFKFEFQSLQAALNSKQCL